MEISEGAVEEVAQELIQNEQGGGVQTQARSSGSGSLLRMGHAMEQRLSELERTVETLLHHPEWQDIQFERLERRLQQLEPVVRVLRRQFAEFSQDMEETPSEETATAEKPPS